MNGTLGIQTCSGTGSKCMKGAATRNLVRTIVKHNQKHQRRLIGDMSKAMTFGVLQFPCSFILQQSGIWGGRRWLIDDGACKLLPSLILTQSREKIDGLIKPMMAELQKRTVQTTMDSYFTSYDQNRR